MATSCRTRSAAVSCSRSSSASSRACRQTPTAWERALRRSREPRGDGPRRQARPAPRAPGTALDRGRRIAQPVVGNVMVEAAPGDPGLQAGPLLTTPATLPLQHHPVVIGRAAEHAEVAVLCDQRRKVFGEHLVRYRRGDLGAHHAVVGHLVDAVAAGQAHDRHGPLIASGRHGSSWRYQAIAVSIASTWASGSRPRGAAIWSRNAGGRRDQHHLHAKCAGGTWRRHPPGQAWVACTPVTIRPAAAQPARRRR